MIEAREQEKIDFVITWVDGSDPVWLAKKQKYSADNTSQGENIARFRDWGTLKYVFRSIEKYANWVNKIYLVTDNQVPKWLDTSNPKVQVIDHKDFIPEEYLPTFSANPIEMNLHKIQGLSEQFVFFNDDMLITQKVKPSDFFKDGKPLSAGLLHIHCVEKKNMIYTICNNDIELINNNFSLKETLSNTNAWFSLKYGFMNIVKNLFLSRCPRFPGLRNTHLPNPYLKSTYEEIWQKEPERLKETCSHKFRNRNDVNQWLVYDWQLASNNFYPNNIFKRGALIDFEKDGERDEVLRKCKKSLNSKHIKLICINDNDGVSGAGGISATVRNMLETKYSKKSGFEK